MLPALTLGASLAGVLSRMVRASLLEVLGQDPIVVAPGETVVLAEGTPLEIRAGAGVVTEDVRDGGDGEKDAPS